MRKKYCERTESRARSHVFCDWVTCIMWLSHVHYVTSHVHYVTESRALCVWVTCIMCLSHVHLHMHYVTTMPSCCMYVCMYVCMYTWIYLYIYNAYFVCMYVCIYVIKYVSIHTCVYMCMHTYIHICLVCIHWMQACIKGYIHKPHCVPNVPACLHVYSYSPSQAQNQGMPWNPSRRRTFGSPQKRVAQKPDGVYTCMYACAYVWACWVSKLPSWLTSNMLCACNRRKTYMYVCMRTWSICGALRGSPQPCMHQQLLGVVRWLTCYWESHNDWP